MTLTFEGDLDGIKANQLAKYLVQRLFNSKFIVQTVNTWTHTVD